MAKKVSDEFLEYIVKSGKTKLTADQLFEEFVSGGFYARVKENMPENVQASTLYWDDNSWKIYIYNYAKLQFGIKTMFGKEKYKNILQ